MAKKSKINKLELGAEILNSLGDIFYQPWEFKDMESLPEGFTEWTSDAIDAWWNENSLEAAETALGWLEKKGLLKNK